jgi:excinuclease UvrABC nuclease subunit
MPAAARLEPPFDLAPVPEAPGVFVIHLRDGEPYVGRTRLLRRRLRRLLEGATVAGRALRLGELAAAVEYESDPSTLGLLLRHYRLMRRHHPADAAIRLRLRPPVFVKVLLSNPWPRTVVSTRLSRSSSFCFGPFRNKAVASRFEQEVLDLFQLRRCQVDLEPSPSHPGCIYGEMMKCLRPCQQAVTQAEYAAETARLVRFLETRGRSLLDAAAAARDSASEALDFEQARLWHERWLRIRETASLCGELAAPLDQLNGAAVLPSAEPGAVRLAVMLGGAWLEPVEFVVAPAGRSVSLDSRLRELFASLAAPRLPAQERAEHVALLAQWYYSSNRECEWRAFPALEAIPYRALVHDISRTARSKGTA